MGETEEISLEEFESLSDEKTRSKVDYDAVIEEIVGRPLTVGSIAKIMLKNSVDKKKVHYSEVTGFLDRLANKAGFTVKAKYEHRKFILVSRK